MRKVIDATPIINYMLNNKIGKGEFCKRCGISRGVLNKILKDQHNVRITAFFKIAKFLNIEVKDLFYK